MKLLRPLLSILLAFSIGGLLFLPPFSPSHNHLASNKTSLQSSPISYHWIDSPYLASDSSQSMPPALHSNSLTLLPASNDITIESPPAVEIPPQSQITITSSPRPDYLSPLASLPRVQSLHPPTRSLYAPSTSGYDSSYPQCGNPQAPKGAGFAILGLNGGKAFTSNSCFSALVSNAPKSRSIYLNTGFDESNISKITPSCKAISSTKGLSSAQADAYALGCSEGTFSLKLYSKSVFHWTPQMLWLDVETGNSWSESDVFLNQQSLQGLTDSLAVLKIPIGIYSTNHQWQKITGNDWNLSGTIADWKAAGTILDCNSPSFSANPTWLIQLSNPIVVDNGVTDADISC